MKSINLHCKSETNNVHLLKNERIFPEPHTTRPAIASVQLDHSIDSTTDLTAPARCHCNDTVFTNWEAWHGGSVASTAKTIETTAMTRSNISLYSFQR